MNLTKRYQVRIQRSQAYTRASMTDRTSYVVREGEKKANDKNESLTTLLIHAKTRYYDRAKERCEQKRKY